MLERTCHFYTNFGTQFKLTIFDFTKCMFFETSVFFTIGLFSFRLNSRITFYIYIYNKTGIIIIKMFLISKEIFSYLNKSYLVMVIVKQTKK